MRVGDGLPANADSLAQWLLQQGCGGQKAASACAWHQVGLHACLFAGSPTSRSPFSVNATTEGVVLAPSAFSITLGDCAKRVQAHACYAHIQDEIVRHYISCNTLTLPSMTATHELVVPRSMPIISFPEAARAALPLQHSAQLFELLGTLDGG